MAEITGSGSVSRRGFLAATGGMLAATPVVGSMASKIVEAPETFPAAPAKFAQGSVIFRAVGYGHGAELWKDVVKAYMDIGFQAIMSIENEDPILPGEVGVERAAFVLKNVRAELLEGK